MGARRVASVAVVLLCVVGGYLAFGGVSAFALNTHVSSGSFGGSGAGGLSGPSGVAVNDETGNVYVVDKGHNRVEEFDSTGSALLGEFDGASAGHALSGPEAIAVDNSGNPLDPSAGDVYVVDTGNRVIDKFTSVGAYVGQLTETTGGASFGALDGVAVDPNGLVWVYQFGVPARIDDFSDALANEYLATRYSPFGASPGFAVDAEDNLYVNRGGEEFAKLDSSGAQLPWAGGGERATAATVNVASGETFVDDVQSIGTYSASGGFLVRFGLGTLNSGSGIAVNDSNGVLYVADTAANVVDVFDQVIVPDVSTGAASGVQATSATLDGTVNPDGETVISCEFEYGTSAAYGQNAPCEPGPGSGSSPVSVSADLQGLQEGSVYHYRLRAANANGTNAGEDQTFITPGRPSIHGQTSGAITQTVATISAQVDPHGLTTTYHFEYGTSTSYGTSVPVPDGNLSATNEDQEVSAELSGLQVGATYHYRVIAVNSLGTAYGPDNTFATIPPALIDGASATSVAASSATLNAQIDPLGNDTAYRFEYGTSTAYGTSAPVPDADIGAGTSDVAVSTHLSSLNVNTTYHYRVIAHNTLGTAASDDHTFIYSTGGAGLPDSRAYEMVTPVHKNAALIGDVFLGLSPAVSEDGSRLIMSAVQCFGDSVSCPANADKVGTPFEFTRTSGGWVAGALAPPASQSGANDAWRVSPDAGTALFAMPTPPVGEDDWYARDADGSFRDIGPMVPPSSPEPLGEQLQSTSPLYATADLSHVVYSDKPLWPFDATAEPVSNYPASYEYVGGGNSAPLLVGVTGGRGSTDLISVCGAELSLYPSNELSADGRTVFFTANPCSSGSGVNAGVPVPAAELFARVNESRTILVSGRSPLECTSSGCLNSPAGDAWFTHASNDGSKVFFEDTQQLTDDANEDNQHGDSADSRFAGCTLTVGANGCNLYEYDFSNPTGRNLLAISAGDTSGGGPRVQGVVAVSPDGSHVYFVAKGILASAANDQGAIAHDGADNLYVFERDASHPAGRVVFVVSLSAQDSDDWGLVPRADVTPDGRFLVFTSHGALTMDDSSSTGAAQVFRYDAQTGRLVRISIGEGGFNDNGNAGVGNASIASPEVHLGPLRTDPTMSSEGSFVFFESPVALTPGALDDVQISGTAAEPQYAYNVYEYHEGQVYLLSDGRDVADSPSPGCQHESAVCLLGTDATGRDVFFTSANRLLPEDGDTGVDVYDARVCTSSEPCIPVAQASPGPCQGDACHGMPAALAPAVGAGTVAFSGPGNLAPSTVSVAKTRAKKRHKPKARKKTGKHGPKRHAGRSRTRHGHTSRSGGK